jgi:hypothetical protein
MLRHMCGFLGGERSQGARLLLLVACITTAPAILRAETSDTKTPKQTSSVEAIRRALEDKTEVEFVETPLTDVVDFIKTRHNIEIQLDNRVLSDANIALDTQVTRNLKGISLRSALRLILRDLDLKYVIQDEVLMITTKDFADSIHETKVYPVRDLLPSDAQADGGAADDYDALVAAIASADTEAAQEGHRPGTIETVPSVAAIVVTQTQETHEKIEQLLVALRKAREQFKD